MLGFVASYSYCLGLKDPDLDIFDDSSKKSSKNDTDETKSEFFPGLWDSVKKGLLDGGQDELVEESEINVIKELAGYEDADEQYWEKNVKAMKEKIAEQNFVTNLVKGAKDLALIWAQKNVNEYLDNQGSPSIVTAIPSTRRKGLSDQEKKFRSKRLEGDEDLGHKGVRTTLEEFLGEDLSLTMVSESGIAFAASGGGYRAMILTIGYLEGLRKIGLLDGIMYAAGVSGGTWAIGPWISSGQTVSAFKQTLLNKISSKQFNVMKVGPGILSSSENIETIVKNILWPKFLWGQPIRSIDFYGFLLGQVLLGKDGYKTHLSDQLEKIKSGRFPFPIYSAVSMSKKDDDSYSYDWYEFNPVEVLARFKKDKEDEGTYLSVPIRAFGSAFEGGKSISTGYVSIAPEPMFGYWLGTFGSAFAINSKDIDAYVARGVAGLKQSATSLNGIMNITASLLVSMIQSIEGVGTARISPAQIFNPFKGYSEMPASWIKNKKYLTLVDAAVSNNIPLMPLLWPERKIKFIIIGDSSSTASSASELKKFFAEAKAQYGYEYGRIDDGANSTLRLYKDTKKYDDTDGKRPEAPRIIYLNYLKDQKLMALTGPGGVAKLTDKEKVEREELRRFIKDKKLEAFDPIACVNGKDGKAGVCNTFNFDYSVDDFEWLSATAEFNVRANKEVIASFIRDELHNVDDVDFPVFGNP